MTQRQRKSRNCCMITLMGLIFKLRLSQYWSTDELLRTPAFGEAFSRDRFKNLLTCLHLNNNETGLHHGDEGFDPLRKIRPIYVVLSSRFRTIFTPKEHICIDEAIVPWKGRLTFKQFIPSKPNRFGVKCTCCVKVTVPTSVILRCM